MEIQTKNHRQCYDPDMLLRDYHVYWKNKNGIFKHVFFYIKINVIPLIIDLPPYTYYI